MVTFISLQLNPMVQKIDTRTDLCHLKKKSTNILFSEEVTLKTLLCLNHQNHSTDCLVIQLLYRYMVHVSQVHFSTLLMCFSPQSSLSSSSVPYHPRWSPYRDVMPTYNQLAASSLLSQQYNTALGLGNTCSGQHACLSPPIGSTVDQTPLPFLHLSSQYLDFTASQPEELPWWNRLSRRCHRSVLPRGGGMH